MISVSGLDTKAHLNSDAHRLFVSETRLFLDIFLEGDALYKFHYDIVNIILFAYIIYIDDI